LVLRSEKEEGTRRRAGSPWQFAYSNLAICLWLGGGIIGSYAAQKSWMQVAETRRRKGPSAQDPLEDRQHRMSILFPSVYPECCCTAVPPKGTYRYSTAPTGTHGIGPVGQGVPRGTGHLCLRTKHFYPAVPFACTAGTLSILPPKPEFFATPTVPLYILGITPILP
jgi:hypothetical protein